MTATILQFPTPVSAESDDENQNMLGPVPGEKSLYDILEDFGKSWEEAIEEYYKDKQ